MRLSRGLSGRADSLTALGEREFDLLVIGGGIIGAGIAAAAARHGLAVALVDRAISAARPRARRRS